MSTGTTFIESELTIEIFAVTRQRLLQQGLTNTTTYDFETSQNLYILLADRDMETYTLTDATSCGPLAANIPISTGFNGTEDSYTNSRKYRKK
jgi:hypothetical protein